MKKLYFFVLSAALVMFSGCASTMRYSEEEIKDFPPSVQENIKNKEIAVGMTKLQVRYSWGGPDEVIPLEPGENGAERVEWIFKKMHLFKSKLIFTGDKLTEIISSEPGIVK